MFGVPLFTKKNVAIEQLLQNNHKDGSIPKDLNNNIDTSNSDPTKAKTACNKPKVKSVHFEDQYYHINPLDKTNYYTRLIYYPGYHNIVYSEEYDTFEDVN